MKLIEGRLRVSASDVANFLACQQLTQLDLQRAQGESSPPRAVDLGFEDLVRRGEEHERAVLAASPAAATGQLSAPPPSTPAAPPQPQAANL